MLQHSVLQCTAAAPVVVGLTSDSPLGCVYTTHTLCTTFEEMKMLECAAVRCNRINKKRANRTQSKYFPLLRIPTYPYIDKMHSMTLFFVIDRSQWQFCSAELMDIVIDFTVNDNVHKTDGHKLHNENCHWLINDSFCKGAYMDMVFEKIVIDRSMTIFVKVHAWTWCLRKLSLIDQWQFL